MSSTTALAEHRNFLNRYYGLSRPIYDVTRKYYLLGRDQTLSRLLREPWDTLVEIGPGTGRNLRKLHAVRPAASYHGIEASDAMLAAAERSCRFARLHHGFAERCDIETLTGERPDRILFSYCLSMVLDPEAAIENARSALQPNGQVVIVDFGDGQSLPRWLNQGLGRWLSTFHVNPMRYDRYRHFGARIHPLFRGYAVEVRIPASSSQRMS